MISVIDTDGVQQFVGLLPDAIHFLQEHDPDATQGLSLAVCPPCESYNHGENFCGFRVQEKCLLPDK